jgi:lycopene elongase/hydratase (dihydrobisanhydrobacterioruberin-forming)
VNASTSSGPIDPRRTAPSRRLGYRLLPGDGYSYVLHLRPREWPIVAGHTFFGFLLALPEAPEASARWIQALLGVTVFVVLLNGGTLAINSAFDRDEGDIGYLDAPPPPPRHLFAFGLSLMVLGQIVAVTLLPATFAIIYAACFVMSILYSVPPLRWKAVAGLDLLINSVGFGSLTAFAGWSLSGVAPPTWALLVLLAFAPLFAALYPLTQLYQMEEDRRRGDRTLAIVLGIRGSLLFSIGMTLLAFGLIAVGLRAGPADRWWPLSLLALAFWMTLLLHWLARHPTMSPAQHKRGMYVALHAWASTNLVILAAVLFPMLRP